MVVFASLLVTILVSIVILLYRKYTKLSRNGIPGPTPLPFIGNLHETVAGKSSTNDPKWLKKYGSVYGYYQGFRPCVVVNDVDLLKKVFVKNFPNFINRTSFGNLPNLLGDSLFFMRGRTWKRTRNIMTPTFSSGKLKTMVPIINRCAGLLADNLENRQGQSVEVRKFFGQFTMDTITATAFGMEIDSQKEPNSPFLKHMGQIFSPSKLGIIGFALAAMFPGLGRFLYKIGLSAWPKESVEFFEDTGKLLIEDRKKNKQTYNDFLYLLINAVVDDSKSEYIQNGNSLDKDTVRKERPEQLLSEDEINAQAFVFFLAGYETTASLLRYAAYVLATQPEFDQKLWTEINQHIGMAEPTYENIGKLKYMDQFIYEVLRFYPPVPRLTRETNEDINLDGKTIPKESIVMIPVYQIHHHPDIYPNPEKFDPERFPWEKKVSPDSTTFLAFGSGPRNCIGMRLAIIEAKIALVYALKKVRFVKSEKTQDDLNLTFAGLLRPKQPIEVMITARG